MTQLGGITRGVNDIRAAFASYLQSATDEVIEAAWSLFPIEPWLLPKFVVFDGVNPFKVKDYPAICLTATTDSDHKRTDVNDDGSIETWPQYAVTLTVVVRPPFNDTTQKYAAEQHDEAVRLGYDLTAIVQNVLLNNPSMGNPESIQIDPLTINTTYMEPIQANNSPQSWVSGSQITMMVRHRTVTYQPAIGSSDTFTLIEEATSGPFS